MLSIKKNYFKGKDYTNIIIIMSTSIFKLKENLKKANTYLLLEKDVDYSDYKKAQKVVSKALTIVNNLDDYKINDISKIYADIAYWDNQFDKNKVEVPSIKRRGASTRIHTSNEWIRQNIKFVRSEFEKKLSPQYGSYEIGDITPIGKVTDKTSSQYFINGTWYAKKILDDLAKK